MKVLKYVLAIFAALAVPGLASADSWKPVGPWAADYGDDYCRLGRVFTDGKNQLELRLDRTQPGPFFRIILIGDGIKPFRGASTWGAKFGPAGQSWKAPILQTKTGDGKQYYDLGPTAVTPFPAFGALGAPGASAAPAAGPPPFKPYNQADERAAAKALTGLELGEGLTEPVQLETGSLEAPIAALQACMSDLVKSWGVDAKRHETLSKPVMPQGAPSAWVPANTFPFSEFAKLNGGRNAIRVMVDETGKPTSCTVQRPSLDPAMNKTACDSIMKNAKFTPALDSAGQAMPSYWITEVFGLLPPPPGMGGGRR